MSTKKTTVVKKTASTAAKKAVKSVASKVTEAAVAATAAGRKALLQKVKDEVAAGRVNVSDKSAVEQDILKGGPQMQAAKCSLVISNACCSWHDSVNDVFFQ